MNRKIVYMLCIVLFFSCKNKMTAEDNLINELKSIDKFYTINLYENDICIGFLNKNDKNEFDCDTGVGFSICKLLELKQINKNEIYIKVSSTRCIEFEKNNSNQDVQPDCKKWNISILEYILLDKQINELKKSNVDEIDLKGKILMKEFKDKIK